MSPWENPNGLGGLSPVVGTATSLIAALGAKHPDTNVILDAKFETGLDGFEQLVATTSPVGMLSWQPDEDGGAMVLCTGNQADGTLATAPMGEASAYRRLTKFMAKTDESMTLQLEIDWAWQARYGKYRMRAPEFGFDQCYSDGTRLFPVYRWLNCDDASDATRDCRWYVQTGNDGSPAYTALPGPDNASVLGAGFVTPTAQIQTPLPFNENKRNYNKFVGTFIFNADKTVQYDGLKVGRRGFGSFASPADTSFHSLGPTSSTLADFAEGLNVAISLRNRTNATKSAARLWIKRVRVKVLA